MGWFWRLAGSFFLVCFRRLPHELLGFGLGGGALFCLPLLLFMRRVICKSEVRLFLLILTITSGFVINVFVESIFWAALFAFIAVGGYYAINEVMNE